MLTTKCLPLTAAQSLDVIRNFAENFKSQNSESKPPKSDVSIDIVN